MKLEQTELTSCKTYFAIIGDFNLMEVSNILNMNYTSGYNKGEEMKDIVGVYECSSWEYGMDYNETLSADEQARVVINPFLSKIEELLQIKEKFDCRFLLMQIAVIINEETPTMGYDKTIIDFCSKTDTEIQVDLYAYPSFTEY